ncbi:MAG: hypothetical protein KC502_16405, partial [Myxococcales bacterium]|nr:hypothetical protein [Myxococcales bacterium]
MPIQSLLGRLCVALVCVALFATPAAPTLLAAGARAVGASTAASDLDAVGTAHAAIIRRGLLTRKGGRGNYRVTALVADDPANTVTAVAVSLERISGGDAATWSGMASSVCQGKPTVISDYQPLNIGPCGVFSADVGDKLMAGGEAEQTFRMTTWMLTNSGMSLQSSTSTVKVHVPTKGSHAVAPEGTSVIGNVPKITKPDGKTQQALSFTTSDTTGAKTVAVVVRGALYNAAGKRVGKLATTITKSASTSAIYEMPLPSGPTSNGWPLKLTFKNAEPSAVVKVFKRVQLGMNMVVPETGTTVTVRAKTVREKAVLTIGNTTWANEVDNSDKGGETKEKVVIALGNIKGVSQVDDASRVVPRFGGRLHVRSSTVRSWNWGAKWQSPDGDKGLATAVRYELRVVTIDATGTLGDMKVRSGSLATASQVGPQLEAFAFVRTAKGLEARAWTTSDRPSPSSLTIFATTEKGKKVFASSSKKAAAVERQFFGKVELSDKTKPGQQFKAEVVLTNAKGLLAKVKCVAKTSDKSAPTSTTVETADGGQLFALLTTEGELEIAATGPAAAQATGVQVTLYDASGKPKTKRYFKMAREISLWEMGDASAPPTDGSFDVAAQFLDAPGGQ